MADVLDSMIPDYSIADYVGGGGAEQFKTVGRIMVGWFRDLGGLQPGEKVLEVGCGIGRIAIPLTQYLAAGTYDGFDIVPHGIQWCREKVTPRYPNFRFFHSDIHNKAYNPAGRIAASEYRFPFADASFDFVFLTSVFTHMLPADVRNYAAQIGRVLRPGGRCFCTAYVISQEARERLERGESLKKFVACEGGYWSDSPETPEAAVAYGQDELFGVLAEAGLEVRTFIPGAWWQHEFAQDILVAHKAV
jgi:SAM-dependent methyltransferase